jgi:hypothetical protein
MTTVADNAWLAVTATPVTATNADGIGPIGPGGATQAGNAVAIPAQIFYLQVTTANARSAANASINAGVSLPANPVLYPKATYKIACAAGQRGVIVWPANATGASTDTIDGATTASTVGLGIAAVLPGQTKEFAAMSNAAGLITWVTVNVINTGGKQPTMTLPATATTMVLLAAESGLLISQLVVAAACAVTLPALAAGLRFTAQNAATQNAAAITYSSSVASKVCGANLHNGVATFVKQAANSIAFTAVSTLGDNLDLVCDGLFWHEFGNSGGAVVSFS